MTELRPGMPAHAVAIIGMAGRFPGARDVDAFWANLVGGVESVTILTREDLLAAGVDPRLVADPSYVPAAAILDDVEAFDAELFGISPREAELMDPQQRLFLECAWAALEHAGYPPRGASDRIGVFGGSGLNGYLLHHLLVDPELLDRVGPYQAVVGNDKDFLATRVSYKLGLEGPSLTIQTACSTSLVAVCAACQSLVDGECDLALAGGVTVRIPHRAGYRYQEEGILAPDGHCRAFDAGARGTVPGSGAGIVVLKPLARAIADRDRVHAVIRGWALNNDGARKVGFTAPSVDGQAAAVAEALALADLEPRTISYIEAHGTGTRLGDPIELAALCRVFGVNGSRPPCAIGSVKTNVGHLDAAAGVTGLIKTALALTHRDLPPTLHFRSPNPEIEALHAPFRVVAERTPWETDGEPRRAGVSSFGIGGTNAHVVLEEAPDPEPSDPGPSHALLVLAGRDEDALNRVSAELARHLKREPIAPVHDVAFTLQTGRVALPQRRAVVARDATSAAALLERPDPERACAGVAGEAPSLVFLFPGQGAQHPGMGAGLHAALPRFAEELDRCAALLAPHLGFDLRSVLFRTSEDDSAARAIEQTAVAQPAIFAVEYALARAWMELGVTPEAMLGHSVGEYVAACLSGVIPLDDALRVVAARGRLMQALPRGAMAAVPLAESALAPLLPPSVSLAAVNAPNLCTVSGPEEAVASLERALAERGVSARRLHTSHAFHSAMMDPMLGAFRAELERVAWGAPEIPWVSNLTGTWITQEEAARPEYWVRHLRETVRFDAGLGAVLARPDRALLEVGPGRTLTGLVRSRSDARGRAVLASTPHPQQALEELEGFLQAAGELWVRGVALDWRALHRGRRRNRAPLPAYPFERARHWIEPPRASAPRGNAPRAAGTIFKRPAVEEWLYLPTWKRAGPLPPAPAADAPKRWLVLEDGCGVGHAIARALEARGDHVTRALPGEGFERRGPREFGIAPSRREDHDALLSAMRQEEGLPEAIVHAWSLEDATPSGSDPERGFAGLLACVQSLAPLARGARVRITVVSEGLQPVTGAEDSRPERATVLGLCRVISQEHPHFACRSVDVAAGGATGIADALVREVTSAADEPEVALRGTHRWVPAYDPLPLPAADAPEGTLERGAHVLIAGGLGRLGLALASHFARAHGARLTLLDRRPLPPRERWAELAAGNGEEEAGTARALLELDAAGAAFAAITCDISDPREVVRAVAEAERRFGTVIVLVHAAGPADEVAFRTIQEITPEHWRAHSAPKLEGLRALEKAFEGRAPAIALATSSLAPILGGVGLAGMASVDRFLDVRAERRTPGEGIRWRVIDWEGWGQRLDAELAVLGREQSELMLSWPEVADVVERVLRAPEVPRVVVATGDLATRLHRWTRLLEGETKPASRVAPAPDGGRAPDEGTEATVASIWRDALGVPSIGADDDFFELGGNSLLGLQVLSRLRGIFEVELPLRSFFEARTPAAMARVIEAERAASSDQTERIAAILDEIESLSDAEIEARLRELPATEPPPAERARPDRSDRARVEGDRVSVPASRPDEEAGPAPMRFSFFFFSADGASPGRDKYRLVLECARFADRHGFDAVWTPERHFVEFGGLYPNPSVLGAALAVTTERVQIRAGSVVLPLHHPIRVAEEWSVIDNLSGGRAAISCASGWHPDDFVLAPDAYADRKAAMTRTIAQVRKLWTGESVSFPGVDGADVPVVIRPRPIQPELPIWITTSGSVETWELAGELGANVLAALGNQTPEELADKVGRYRSSRARHGHDPAGGTVSLMLHAHLGPDLDAVRARVRAPLAEYLRTHMAQRDRYVPIDRITETDKRTLADLAVEHYLERASLLGTPSFCSRRVNRLAAAGVDEIACLLDFGLDASSVLAGLEHLESLRAVHAIAKVPA